MISKLRINAKEGIVMSDDGKIVDISHIKNGRDRERLTELLVQTVSLAQLIHDESTIPTEIKLHFCEELNMLVDYVKKEVTRIGRV